MFYTENLPLTTPENTDEEFSEFDDDNVDISQCHVFR